MKKVVAFILCICTLLSMSVVAFASDDVQAATPRSGIANGGTGHITAMAVSLRKNAGTSGEFKSYLYKPDEFIVLGTATANQMDWYYARITSGGSFGSVGYFASQYSASGSSWQEWYVSATDVYFRSGPGTNYSAYGVLDEGDTFFITGNIYVGNTQWFKVVMTSGTYQGYEGYINETLVSFG